MAKAQAEPAQQKSKGGRPTKFDAKLVRQARELALLGLTDAEIARVFDVATSTFKEWKAAHPAFARALAQSGYATDPEYANKLIAVMDRHQLQALDGGDL